MKTPILSTEEADVFCDIIKHMTSDVAVTGSKTREDHIKVIRELLGIEGPKVYRALLAPNGTDVPLITVIENTLGGDPVWARGQPGSYYMTLVGAFPETKTGVLHNNVGTSGTGENRVNAYRYTDDVVYYEIQSGAVYTDSLYQNANYIEVKVYS